MSYDKLLKKGISAPVTNSFQEHWVIRRRIIMESYIRALKNGDKNVYFIDGMSFFTGTEYDCVTVDGCHPNDQGFTKMAQGIFPTLREIIYK